MPIIEVWGFPSKVEEAKNLEFQQALKLTVSQIGDLKLQVDQVSVFIPELNTGQTDFVIPESGYPQPEVIILKVWGLFAKPERTVTIQKFLAQRLMEKVSQYFPESMVEVFVQPFNPENGFACSNQA